MFKRKAIITSALFGACLLLVIFGSNAGSLEPELITPGITQRPPEIPQLTLAEMRNIPGLRRIEIYKSSRRLCLYADDILLKEYPIGIGANPMGPKLMEGDEKTPEGEYYLCYINKNTSYHRFIGISYPNEQDAERGLQAGLLSEAEHRNIVRRIQRRQQPPWKTRLGGEIGIHGKGPGNTLGCISMRDQDVEEIYQQITVNGSVKVSIYPQDNRK